MPLARTLSLAVAGFVLSMPILLCGQTPAQPGTALAAPGEYPVIELRRYVIKPGEEQHFAKYFEAYFPEAMQQLGVYVAGEFLERGHHGFTWLRCFASMDDRAKDNAQLYYGPVWKEHKALMNGMMDDSDNVLLLQPLTPARGVPIYASVDPIKEPEGAKGVVVAQIFSLKEGAAKDFPAKVEAAFAKYRAAGAKEVAVLTTLNARNNFPQLPVKTDGPYLVWIGILPNDSDVNAKVLPLMEESAKDTSLAEMLRGATETLTLDPAPRSRLRWMPGAQ